VYKSVESAGSIEECVLHFVHRQSELPLQCPTPFAKAEVSH
jgi:hypothetical protein